LNYKPVAFKAGKVRSHRVISEVQRVRKFVYSALSSTQELKDFSSRTFEQAVSPAYIFHQPKDHVYSY
jgi:hypothetical protein